MSHLMNANLRIEAIESFESALASSVACRKTNHLSEREFHRTSAGTGSQEFQLLTSPHAVSRSPQINNYRIANFSSVQFRWDFVSAFQRTAHQQDMHFRLVILIVYPSSASFHPELVAPFILLQKARSRVAELNDTCSQLLGQDDMAVLILIVVVLLRVADSVWELRLRKAFSCLAA